MADDKKYIPEAAPPAEAPTPAIENAAVPEQSAPEPALTDAEAVMLEHEGQEPLFEMGEVVPDSADAAIHAELEEPSTPSDATRAEKEEIVYLNLSDLHPFKNHPCGDIIHPPQKSEVKKQSVHYRILRSYKDTLHGRSVGI